jgi:hypothetical protein
MEQSTQKKIWVTPELIVLVRSKPEEAVLTACKPNGSSGPDVVNLGCMFAGVYGCGQCSNVEGS